MGNKQRPLVSAQCAVHSVERTSCCAPLIHDSQAAPPTCVKGWSSGQQRVAGGLCVDCSRLTHLVRPLIVSDSRSFDCHPLALGSPPAPRPVLLFYTSVLARCVATINNQGLGRCRASFASTLRSTVLVTLTLGGAIPPPSSHQRVFSFPNHIGSSSLGAQIPIEVTVVGSGARHGKGATASR